MTQSPEKWKKEFREKWADGIENGMRHFDGEVMESFISSLLTNQKREILEEVKSELQWAGEEVVGHLETMYPEALKAVSKNARKSLKNFTNNFIEGKIGALTTDPNKGANS